LARFCQRDGSGHIRAGAWPLEAALIESARRTPHAKTIVQQQLDAVTTRDWG
jgi:hypothetical protein